MDRTPEEAMMYAHQDSNVGSLLRLLASSNASSDVVNAFRE